MRGSHAALALRLMAGVTLLIGGAQAAMAATISNTVNFTVTSTNGTASQLFDFDKFDPLLGTITNATLDLTGVISISATITGSGNTYFSSAHAANFATFRFILVEPDLMGTFSPLQAGALCDDYVYVCSATGTNSRALNFNFPFNANIPFDIGTTEFNGGLPGQFELALTNDITGSCGLLSICTYSGSASWSGSATFTYDYTPASTQPIDVPEPASLTLVSAGLVGAAAMRRRHKAKSA